MIRLLFRAASVASTIRAGYRGPKALGRNLVRRQAHKSLARWMRRNGL